MSSLAIDKESKLVVIETKPRRVEVSRSGTPGPAGLRWRDDVGSGAWTVDTTYAVRDACVHAGASYRCLAAHVATVDNEPATLGGAAYWTVIAAKGAKGDKGDTGDQGPQGDQGLTGDTGPQGDPGVAATVAIGTVTTGAPGSAASVTNVGTPNAAVLDISIPQGDEGPAGPGSGDMLASTYDPGNVGGDAFARGNHTGTQSADTLTDGTTNKAFTATERTKLAGIATAATANDTDANLKNRANHTGTQTASTISDFSTAADARVSAAIGATVQAYSANLSEYAAVNPTAAGLALLDDASAADQRTTLELGTSAVKNTGTSGDAVPLLNGANTWSGAQTITTTAAGSTILKLVSTDASATGGPQFDLDRVSASPAASDVAGVQRFLGRDSGGNVTSYASVSATILDPTDSSEDGQLAVQVPVAGAQTAALSIANGVIVGAPTGSYQGTGTVNATGYYINGVAVASTAGNTFTGTQTISAATPTLTLQKTASGTAASIFSYTGASPRWELALGDQTAESGSNLGSNLVFARFSDAGAFIDSPLTIARATGIVSMSAGAVIGDGSADSVTIKGTVVNSYSSGLFSNANAAAWRTALELGTAAVANLIDEDDMASNSATALPSQQSVKAYVDGLSANIILDEDDFASNSAVLAPSQQSAKAYVNHRQHDRPSRADAIANFHPITAPDFIRTAGYAVAGDGGGALYEKSVSEPSHAGKLSITLAGGATAWYEYVPGPEGINPLAIGVVMGATIDVNDVASLTNYADTTALAAATIGGSVEAVKVAGVPWRRVDAAHPRLGPELVTNGAFTTDTGWTKGTGWTISAGAAQAAAGVLSEIYQAKHADVVNGGIYIVAANLTITAGDFQLSVGGTYTGGIVSSGAYQKVLTASTGGSVTILKGATGAGTADDFSIKKLPADAVKSADGAWWAVCDLRYAPVGTGAVTGTDSLAAVVAAQAVSEALKVPILWPSGDIRILIPDGSQQILVSYGEWGLHWKFAGRTRFILDDNPAYTAVGQSGNNFLGSAKLNETNLFSRNVSQRFILEQGMVIQGTWWRDIEKGGRSWTGALPYRCHAIAPTNTGTVRIEGVEIIDIMGFAMRTRSCGQVIYTKNRLTRIAGDGYRAEDCHNIQIFGNYGLHVDDNIVAVPDWDDISNEAGPRRAGISVTGNVFESCRGMLVLGPAATDISHNVLRRMYSHGITAFAQTADVSDRGEGGFRTTTISHNIIEDTLKESAIANPPDGTWSTDIYGINIQGGSPTSLTGTGTGTPATLPYASTTQAWGAMHAQDIVGSDAVAGFRGAGLQCNNNTIMRTHQGGSTYSCMGYGRRFTRWGFDNPAIGDTEFAKSGIQLRGDFYGARIVGNIIQNFPLGAGIYLGRASTNMAFRRVLISMNQIANVLYGIDCDAGAARYQDIAIVHNDIDVDPYRIQSARAAGNKWTAGFNADAPCCIHLTHLRGTYVAFNHLRDAANPWSLEGGAVEAIQYNTLRGNIGYVGIETGTAASSTDADNVGLGRIPRSGDMMTYRIQDLDPASATFEQDQAGMLTYSAAMPASGRYIFGHKVDTDAGIYLRLTTGTAHVLNTDWKLM